jgi:negative regulator of flagellin synthesis FlgM
MKIGSFDSKPPGPIPADRKSEAAPSKSATVPSTEVALSSAATGLTEGAGDPAFDAGKVERIANAIREGKFTVNPEAIADKLIVNAEELLGRKLS